MPFLQRAVIAATAIVFCAGPANARGGSYSGAWPVTITGSQFGNGTGCLTLTQNASGGSASLVFDNQKYPYGSYVVVRGILVANITEPLYGQNGVLTFTAHADSGRPGSGLFEDLRGGSNFDFGDLTFGTKNGC